MSTVKGWDLTAFSSTLESCFYPSLRCLDSFSTATATTLGHSLYGAWSTQVAPQVPSSSSL